MGTLKTKQGLIKKRKEQSQFFRQGHSTHRITESFFYFQFVESYDIFDSLVTNPYFLGCYLLIHLMDRFKNMNTNSYNSKELFNSTTDANFILFKKTKSISRGGFGTQSNILDGANCENNERLSYVRNIRNFVKVTSSPFALLFIYSINKHFNLILFFNLQFNGIGHVLRKRARTKRCNYKYKNHQPALSP